MASTVAVYFVASPLQYLAARQIAQTHEAGARQLLVWYQPGVGPIVRPEHWDATAYMPWPRLSPLPGRFGRHRRLRENIRLVASLVGRCDTLHLHSAVFDTEAINYFLHALPRAAGAREMRARILPDGLISVRRYPLSPAKRALQRLRWLRRLAAPELKYTGFSGDRIGSDAAFCDRIYVLPGMPHEYPSAKVVTLQPLAQPSAAQPAEDAPRERRALVVGQPLVGAGLLDAQDLPAVSARLHGWLREQGIERIQYKGHPKDPNLELCAPGDEVLSLDEPLELWLARQRFDAIVGVRSTALLFARQLYGPSTEVMAFGWGQVRFKSAAERRDMERTFKSCGVVIDQ
ncbi:polysialyltransferase family glycosyltransferase [Aquincola sp. MAHUQ-54]|uniref:Polysialyltransferase family glycosyltransferase n=1 Tax=Aquincola agrisoli TaxID=3119538 RepID=A0AAW9QB16_9BURK